ncbi:hypothetical protein [Pseudoalteromonas luteoviolacea]|uniref:Uncharacterized protein n=1 Tax=Pseudoalteromonas luteoviolacea NCIMB 1942 TaxID=1365253 RepID=A0A167CP78_9GAMM|nr:hypothetical protein [Pseudoalteromonas luteoviolacea]KZN47898.1 hypothetical protein N482_01230 [Pseudoalteromonas luteoviolacea NCIMB 1942]KZX02389.1 hypothetical protein JL49_00120 [Pseudoalteromonas luteoviolacea]
MKKITLTRSLLSAAIILSLGGCGGSSSDNSSANNPLTPTVEKVVEKTIQLETVFRGCENDEAKPNIDIVFHNANGEVVATAKTDAEGKYAGKVPEAAMHVSAIDSEAETNQVHTYMEIGEGVNLGKIYFSRPSPLPACPIESDYFCDRVDVDLSELAAVYPGYKLVDKNWVLEHELSNSSQTIDVYNCESNGTHHFALVSPSGDEAVAARIPVKNVSVDSLKSEAFTHGGIKVSTKSYISDGSARIMSLEPEGTNGAYDMGFFIPEDYMPFVFPSLESTFNYRISRHEDLYTGSSDFNASAYIASRTVIADDGTVDVELPVNVNNDFGSAFFAGNVNNNFNFSYDFSHVDKRLHMLRLNFDFTTTDGQSVKWEVQGNVAGTLPDFQFGDALDFGNADFSVLKEFSILLWAHPHAPQGLNDYRSFLASKEGAFRFSLPEYQSYTSISYLFTPNK